MSGNCAGHEEGKQDTFSYRVVARRKDIVGPRLEKVGRPHDPKDLPKPPAPAKPPEVPKPPEPPSR